MPMLFDMDLKSPSVSDFFGFTPEIPIADVLSGKVPFAEQAVRVGRMSPFQPHAKPKSIRHVSCWQSIPRTH